MTDASLIVIHDFSKLFRGNDSSKGTFILNGKTGEDGKVEGSAYTESVGPIEDDYAKHLAGEKGLGIIHAELILERFKLGCIFSILLVIVFFSLFLAHSSG